MFSPQLHYNESIRMSPGKWSNQEGYGSSLKHKEENIVSCRWYNILQYTSFVNTK